jgi:hypothetical protein
VKKSSSSSPNTKFTGGELTAAFMSLHGSHAPVEQQTREQRSQWHRAPERSAQYLFGYASLPITILISVTPEWCLSIRRIVMATFPRGSILVQIT